MAQSVGVLDRRGLFHVHVPREETPCTHREGDTDCDGAVTSSSIKKGLSPGMAIGAMVVGHCLVCIPVTHNAYVGAINGINFPVFSRASFGMRGSYFAVALRGIAAVVWFGIQTHQAGQCVAAMIEAMIPSFKQFHKPLSASLHASFADILCFFIAWILQGFLLFFRVSQLRYLFLAKTCVMPFFGIVLFGWAVGKGHGFGPLFSKPSRSEDGTPVSVLFLQCMTAAIGPKATLALNMPDFTRYARNPRQVLWTQPVGLIFLVSLCGTLGAVVTSAAEGIYGEQTWNPLEVAGFWKSRPALFFAGFFWFFGAIGTNIAANSVSFSNDLSMFFPRYVNMRRGAYICACLSPLTMPWYIQNNATVFAIFLNGCPFILGSVAGIMLVDYLICRGRRLSLQDLYKPDGIYSFSWGWTWCCRPIVRFTKGWHWRAMVAFVLGIVFNMPGLAAECGRPGVPKGLRYLFSVSWLFSILTSGVLYGFSWPIVSVKQGHGQGILLQNMGTGNGDGQGNTSGQANTSGQGNTGAQGDTGKQGNA